MRRETRHMRAVLKAQINKTDRNDTRGIAHGRLAQPSGRQLMLPGQLDLFGNCTQPSTRLIGLQLCLSSACSACGSNIVTIGRLTKPSPQSDTIRHKPGSDRHVRFGSFTTAPNRRRVRPCPLCPRKRQ
jgi:hypothetical protein